MGLLFLPEEDETATRGTDEEVVAEDWDAHVEESASVDIQECDVVFLLVEQRPLGRLEAGGVGVVVHLPRLVGGLRAPTVANGTESHVAVDVVVIDDALGQLDGDVLGK